MAKSSVPCTVEHVHHVGIAVKDLESAVKVYRELFGLEAGPVMENKDYAVRGCFIRVKDTNLEFVQATSPESAIAKFIEAKGEGLHHVCFEVEDVGKRLEALGAKGVRLVDQKPRRGLAGGLIAFVHPSVANGVLIELAQH